MSKSFFGNPESPLFGVYHAPRGGKKNDGSERAVVICPPVGQEYLRSHWSLRMLATQLARKGIHVLRFDYHGIGDSAGSVEDVQSLDTWTHSLTQTIDHLKTEASVNSVMLIGQRMGGLLAGLTAMLRPDVNSLVLWESVICGQEYLDELRQMHAQMLDLWVCKMKTPDDDQYEEILGSLYQRDLVQEIEQTKLDVSRIIQPHLIVESPTSNRQFSSHEPSIQKVIAANRDGAWGDLREIENAFLRPITTSTIVKTVDDMFNRLQQFGALNAMESETLKSRSIAGAV